ncbi:hypothetical protein [Sphingomonas nostoxanthinifaciens]|uniref:hypothetical protein n=1 Tax=Sphingomonas nostoxanthinifaciens TaxID=2872652 RepID=UPI001CC20D7B|nr:hypothetical protein [Sphingomonas nostoxanthinifaciens]UAK25750.1 hypothetical protein K8P63_06355 [Sphingomonas nostoxanthinifaciens]
MGIINREPTGRNILKDVVATVRPIGKLNKEGSLERVSIVTRDVLAEQPIPQSAAALSLTNILHLTADEKLVNTIPARRLGFSQQGYGLFHETSHILCDQSQQFIQPCHLAPYPLPLIGSGAIASHWTV